MLSRGKFVIAGSVLTATAMLLAEKVDPRNTSAFFYLIDMGAHVLNNLDPERAHDVAIQLMHAGFHPIYDKNYPALHTKLFGLEFNSPIGMAAGFDKQARVIKPLFQMGFGFVEVGGVTPLPQQGNPKPRLFRLEEDRALVNRMGLNSQGVVRVGKRVRNAKKFKSHGVVAVNMSQNSYSSNIEEDYTMLVEHLAEHADMLVMNVSCPNTGRRLEINEGMMELVRMVKTKMNKEVHKPPLLIKIGPDMSYTALEQLSILALDGVIDGFVISNTTTRRSLSIVDSIIESDATEDKDESSVKELSTTLKSKHAMERGGLSGDPLKPLALATLRQVYVLTKGKIPLIGVGGISCGKDAYERIRAGASIVQIYTVMILNGPSAIAKINQELAELLEKDGLSCIADAVGLDNKGFVP